ncbi:MAG: hypothetical protein RLZZ546_572 [Bacteroidota bacterium]|jgi:hypothetical protein
MYKQTDNSKLELQLPNLKTKCIFFSYFIVKV